MMLETYAAADYLMKLYGTKSRPASHFPFNFMMITDITAESNASSILSGIRTWFKLMPKHGWANWVVRK